MLLVSTSAALLQSAGLEMGTIVRTRGLFVVKGSATNADSTQLGAFGFAIVEDRARAGGIAQLPIPVTNSADDAFFVHQSFAQAFNFESAVGVESNICAQYVIDSKAMRKVSDNAIVVTVENAGAQSIDIALFCRFLFKRA